MLKSIVLVLNLFLILQAVKSEDSCAKGPSVWCSSLQNSIMCNAFDHCLQTIWLKHERYTNNIETNQPEDNLRPTPCFNCQQCLTSSNIDKCSMVQGFKVQIKQMIDHKLPIKTICELVQHCETSPVKLASVHLKTSYSTHPLDDQKTCGFCLFVISKLQKALQQNSTQQEIETYLKGACSVLPSKDDVNKCIETVDKYLPELYNMLRNNIDAGIICKVIKMCPNKLYQPEIQNDETSVEKDEDSTLINMKNIKIKVFDTKNTKVLTPLSNEMLVQTLKKTDGVACELCTTVFEMVRVMVENKLEQKLVIKFIEDNLCQRLGTFNDTCIDLVNQKAPEIFDQIDKALKSDICLELGLCSRQQVPLPDMNHLGLLEMDKPANSLNCTFCKLTMKEVKEKLTNGKSQSHILDYINKNLCSKAGKSQEMCKTLIDSYGPMFLEMVARDINPTQICIMLGFCDKQEQEVIIQKQIKADSVCVICEFTLSILQKYLNKNASEPEIEKWLKYVCDNDFPKPLRNECSIFVSTYGPIVIELLVKEVNPESICKTIGACQKKVVEPTETRIAFKSRKEMNEELKRAELHKKLTLTKLGSNSSCVVCEFTLNLLTQYVSLNSTEPEVEKWLEYVCSSVMPAPIRGECNAFVETYGPTVIALLIKEVNPDKICQLIRLCPKSYDYSPATNVVVKKDTNYFKDLIARKMTAYRASNVTCGICKLVMEFIDDKMEVPRTEKLVEFTVENLCQMVPNSLRAECDVIMKEHGQRVLDFLKDNTDPTTICQRVGACKKQETNPMNQKLIQSSQEEALKSKSDSIECSVCLLVTQNVDQLLKENKTDIEIVQELVKLCNEIPTDLKSQCSAFIKEYGVEVIEIIANDLSPEEACAALKMCTKKVAVPKLDLVKEEIKPKAKNGSLECSLCLYTAELVDSLLKKNKTDEEIVKELEDICHFFPVKLVGQCISFIDEYGPYVLQLIAADLDPEQTCAALKLCEKSILSGKSNLIKRQFKHE